MRLGPLLAVLALLLLFSSALGAEGASVWVSIPLPQPDGTTVEKDLKVTYDETGKITELWDPAGGIEVRFTPFSVSGIAGKLIAVFNNQNQSVILRGASYTTSQYAFSVLSSGGRAVYSLFGSKNANGSFQWVVENRVSPLKVERREIQVDSLGRITSFAKKTFLSAGTLNAISPKPWAQTVLSEQYAYSGNGLDPVSLNGETIAYDNVGGKTVVMDDGTYSYTYFDNGYLSSITDTQTGAAYQFPEPVLGTPDFEVDSDAACNDVCALENIETHPALSPVLDENPDAQLVLSQWSRTCDVSWAEPSGTGDVPEYVCCTIVRQPTGIPEVPYTYEKHAVYLDGADRLFADALPACINTQTFRYSRYAADVGLMVYELGTTFAQRRALEGVFPEVFGNTPEDRTLAWFGNAADLSESLATSNLEGFQTALEKAREELPDSETTPESKKNATNLSVVGSSGPKENTSGDSTLNTSDALTSSARQTQETQSKTVTAVVVPPGQDPPADVGIASCAEKAGAACTGTQTASCTSLSSGYTSGTAACQSEQSSPACNPNNNDCCRWNLANCVGSVCGDGMVSGAEQCDDGGVQSGDGCSSTCRTEAVTISGTVRDTEGNPVSGATVRVNTLTTTTAQNGAFSIPPGSHHLPYAGAFSVQVEPLPSGYESVEAANALVQSASYQWQVLGVNCPASTQRCEDALSTWATQSQIDDLLAPNRATQRDLADDQAFDFTLTPTPPEPACGDGTIDAGEACDGANLGGATCPSLGYDGGTLSCDDQCQIDASGCTTSQPEFLSYTTDAGSAQLRYRLPHYQNQQDTTGSDGLSRDPGQVCYSTSSLFALSGTSASCPGTTDSIYVDVADYEWEARLNNQTPGTYYAVGRERTSEAAYTWGPWGPQNTFEVAGQTGGDLSATAQRSGNTITFSLSNLADGTGQVCYKKGAFSYGLVGSYYGASCAIAGGTLLSCSGSTSCSATTPALSDGTYHLAAQTGTANWISASPSTVTLAPQTCAATPGAQCSAGQTASCNDLLGGYYTGTASCNAEPSCSPGGAGCCAWNTTTCQELVQPTFVGLEKGPTSVRLRFRLPLHAQDRSFDAGEVCYTMGSGVYSLVGTSQSCPYTKKSLFLYGPGDLLSWTYDDEWASAQLSVSPGTYYVVARQRSVDGTALGPWSTAQSFTMPDPSGSDFYTSVSAQAGQITINATGVVPTEGTTSPSRAKYCYWSTGGAGFPIGSYYGAPCEGLGFGRQAAECTSAGDTCDLTISGVAPGTYMVAGTTGGILWKALATNLVVP